MKKISAIFIIMLLFFTGCGKEKKVKINLPANEKIENIPSFVMQGFLLKSTENGKTKFEIYSKTAQIFELKKEAYAQTVEAKIFEDDGKISILKGDRAIINTETNSVEINGNVVLNGSSGIVLKTEKLFWDDKNKKIFSDEEVTIIKKNNVIKGIGFESDSALKNIKLKNKVELKARDLQDE